MDQKKIVKTNSDRMDWQAVKALLYAFLVMDFRNQAFGQVTRSGPKEIFSPLYWVTGQNLLLSFFVSGILFARVESYAFSLICLSVSMLVCVTSIIVEFHEIVLSPSDMHVIGHQPVSYRTYAAARIGNLLIYICYVILTLNIVPMILGTGLLETTIWFPFLFCLSTLVGSFLASGCVILFYVVVSGGSPSTKIQETLAWTQAALMLITGYGGQAVLRDSKDQLEMAVYHLPSWFQWTPPGLLAQFINSSNHPGGSISWWIPISAVMLTCAVWYAVYRLLASSYAELSEATGLQVNKVLPGLAVSGSLFGTPVDSSWDEKKVERGLGYWFGKFMLFRDASFRMRIWPNFGIPIAFLGIGLFTGELVNPMVQHGKQVGITLTALYSVVFPLPAIFHSMKFSKEYQASWLLSVSPLQYPSEFIRGLQRTIFWWVMFPFVVMVTCLLAFAWRHPIDVAIHVVIVCLLIVLSSSLSAGLVFRELPFSRPLGRGELMGPIIPVLAVVSSVGIVLGGIHYLVSFSYPAMFLYVLVLAAGTFAFGKFNQKKLDRLANRGWSIEKN